VRVRAYVRIIVFLRVSVNVLTFVCLSYAGMHISQICKINVLYVYTYAQANQRRCIYRCGVLMPVYTYTCACI